MGRECYHGCSAKELGMKLGNWVWWDRERRDLQADYLVFLARVACVLTGVPAVIKDWEKAQGWEGRLTERPVFRIRSIEDMGKKVLELVLCFSVSDKTWGLDLGEGGSGEGLQLAYLFSYSAHLVCLQ